MGLFGMGGPPRGGGGGTSDALVAEISARIAAAVQSGSVRADGLSSGPGDRPPGSHAGLAVWIADRLEGIMGRGDGDARFAGDGAVAIAVRQELAVPGAVERLLGRGRLAEEVDRIVAAVVARRLLLTASGDLASRRVDAEAVRLETVDDAALVRRFARSPSCRLDPPPADPARRRIWVREMLLGETVAISTGMLAPLDVARIAIACRVPTDLAAGLGGAEAPLRAPPHHLGTSAANQETRRSRAAALSQQAPETLSKRFGAVPGFAERLVGPDRTDLIAAALMAEELRRLARLPGSSGSPGAALSIDLADLVMDASGDLMFAGDLVVGDERICRLESPGGGVLEASAWSEGCGPADLAALDVFFGAFGSPRDDGELPDSLAFRVLDLVAVRVAADAYRAASADTVMFVLEDREGPSLVSVRVPSGGSRAGAVAHVSERLPGAVCLDDLPLDEAALLWSSLA